MGHSSMPKVKITRIFRPTLMLPMCDAKITPQRWNGMSDKCQCHAKIEVNGRSLCGKHAGSYLLALHLKEPWIDPISGVCR